jgi:hypothetical protein
VTGQQSVSFDRIAHRYDETRGGDRRGSRRDTAEAITEWGTAAGLVRIADRELVDTFQQAPADLADVLEKRTFSFVWDLDDVTWNEVVQPVIDGLRALPEPTRPRQLVHHRDVLVFEK